MITSQKKNAMLMFPTLNDTILLEAYRKALELRMNQTFIQLLKDEILRRELSH